MSYWYLKIRIFHMKFWVFSSPLKVGYPVLRKHVSTRQAPLDLTRGCLLPLRHAHSSSSQTPALFIWHAGLFFLLPAFLPHCLLSLTSLFLLFLPCFLSLLGLSRHLSLRSQTENEQNYHIMKMRWRWALTLSSNVTSWSDLHFLKISPHVWSWSCHLKTKEHFNLGECNLL